MAIDRSTAVFFDATCLFAAAQSPTGGSARLLRLCRLGWFPGWASEPVLVEAERALRRRGSSAALARFEELVRQALLQFAQVPANPTGRQSGINAKDAHVYAAARACGARYLITLDKSLSDEVNAQAGDPFALSPGEFLQRILPTHGDYSVEPGAGQHPGTGGGGV